MENKTAPTSSNHAWHALLFLLIGFFLALSLAAAAVSYGYTQLEARFTAQNEKIAEIASAQKNLASAEVLAPKIAALEERLTGLESQVHRNHFDPLILALLHLEERLHSGEPYARELDILSGILPTKDQLRPALDTLSAYAETGIPTITALHDRFAAASGDLLRHTGSSNASWLKRFIVIRKLNPEGQTVDAAIARAQTAIENGHIDTALTEIEPYKNVPDSSVAAAWITDARAYDSAQQAIALLHDRIDAIAGTTP